MEKMEKGQRIDLEFAQQGRDYVVTGVIMRNGKPARHREWLDTVMPSPRQSAEIALVADNPGDWMFHCHVLEHQAGGMMACIRVT